MAEPGCWGKAVSRSATQVCELEVGHTSLDDGAARALASITRLRRLHLRRVGFATPAGFPLLTALQARCPPWATCALPGRAAAIQTVHMRLTQSTACLLAVALTHQVHLQGRCLKT